MADQDRTVLPTARPEAQPFRWSELDQEQRKVASLIHQWMVRFVDSTPIGLPAQGPFTWQAADLQRPSNVLLIHGGRGSGKTSVMLTMLEIWRRSLMEGLEYPGADRPACNDGPSEAGDKEKERSLRYLLAGTPFDDALVAGAHPGWIIPLKPLDLQPLPQSASLLTWIASRIFEFASLLEQLATGTLEGEAPQPIASWHPESRNEAPWRKPWREFATAAAYGWESNLDQRRGGLDPEAFAEELTQAERSRHDVVVKWRAFVSAVVKYARQQFPRTIDGKARLVLPIDDVDMNPNRCVEVLELVRFLWHPQLVFMLTGQSRLFVKMLRVSCHGLMRGGLGSGGVNRSEFQSLDARPSAHELAVQAYDRVIPPGQRFSLASLAPDVRLHHLLRLLHATLFNAEPTSDEKPGEKPPVEQWLEKIGGQYKHLGAFLGRFHAHPHLQVALPQYFRRLRNLEQALVRETAKNEKLTQPELAYVLWHDAIENQAFSRLSDRGLRHAVQFPLVSDDGRTWKHKLRVALNAPIRQRGHLHSRHLRALRDVNLRYEFSTATDFAWKVRGDFPREVPDHLTALLLLAIDVAADAEDAVECRPELEGRFQLDGLVAPHVRVLVPVEFAFGVLHVPFSWPTPDWVGARHAAYFNAYWNQGLSAALARGKEKRKKKKTEQGQELEELLALFLRGILWAHQDLREPEEAPGAWQDRLEDCTRAHESLESNASRTVHEQAFLEWFDERLPLLAEPESGLPPHIVAELRRTLLETQKQQAPALKLKAARLTRAERALEEAKPPDLKLSAKRLLRRVDAQLRRAAAPRRAEARKRAEARQPSRRKPPSAPRPTHAHH
ncbi:hypothetical protein [Pyxidicoccus sp. MSG2]|uniref:hypothetical protein n=1 Tax=Pyxidicoccus sp. MSG2 TaxID=2996790 RepID=UPI00226F6ABB|nr:hypothetical protein [Pyxidicoccus sp. MSG2]MCY1015621.1 hypothetical protein [Pyxidicoccus sp. MSG2]